MRRFAVVVLVALGILGAGAGLAYRYVDDEVRGPRRAGQAAVQVTVPPGTSTSAIGNILKQAGVIDSTFIYELYVRLFGHTSLEAGQYQVPGGMSMAQVVSLLEHNARGLEISITVPEGYAAKQIGRLLETKGLFSADAYVNAEKTGSFSADFLAGQQPGYGLEGYLFPDTYFVDPKATPADVINLQLRRFGDRVPADLRAKAAVHQITFAQAVVLASIIEREARFSDDRPQVAAVFYNRMARGMTLDADATLLYARGATSGEVTEDDKKINSPYNTYRNVGLPPGAISNPGLPSIMAALEPATNTYLYYVTDGAGHAHFTRTLAEHQRCQNDINHCPTTP